MKYLMILLILLSLAIVACDKEEQIEEQIEIPDEPQTEAGNRHAIIETSMGTMKFELYEEHAPITTANFINLSESGFYDGLVFHRVMKDFMIQGGDPESTGHGGPGYTIKDEFHEELKHDIGVLSMANVGRPDSGGSQFFITAVETPWLDGKHSVFGKIIEGEDVLIAISEVKVSSSHRPLEDVIIQEIRIV